jgi:hypothetical protein
MQAPEFHHGHPDWPGWRVALVLDATPGTPEAWPCWHACAIYGEIAGGALQPARPLVLWDRHMRRQAVWLLRKALAGLGVAETERMADARETIAEAQRRNLPPAVGLSGRRRLTIDEAFGLLTPAQLAATNQALGMIAEGA